MAFERLNGTLRRLFGQVLIEAGRRGTSSDAALTVNQDSGSAANLLDLKAGVSKFKVDKNGTIVATNASSSKIGTENASSNISIGYNCNASGVGAAAIGYSCTGGSEGVISVALGQSCNAGGVRSTALGYGTVTKNNGHFACGYSEPVGGRSQANIQTFHRITTNSDSTILTTSSAEIFRMVISAKRAITFIGVVTAFSDSTDGYKVAGWEIKGIITRDASNNTRIVGTPTITLLGADTEAATWDVTSITADDTNEALSITVTGEADTTIHWNASLFYGQIGHA